MTQPETMKGKAAGKKFFGEMVKAFPDLKATNTNVWGVGDFVIAEGAMTGTHKGVLMGIQPTKKQVNLHGLDVIQFNKEGKIVKGTSYGNGAEMMMQLGLMPQPGAAKPGTAAPAKTDAKPGTAAPAKTDAKPATPAPAKTDAKPATPAPAKK
jgi:predicted ester cyclase